MACALRIVLLGKNDSETSRVRNLILRINESEEPTALEEHNVIPISGTVENRHITVINTFHLLKPNISDHQIAQTVCECVNFSDPGPHVFILVLQYNDFTEEDMTRVKYVLKTFSEEALKRTIVITTTHKSCMTKHTTVHELIKECGEGHLKLDERKPEWHSEIFKSVDKILKENKEEYLTCEIYHDVGTPVDEDQSRSDDSVRSEEEYKVHSHRKDDVKPKERTKANLRDHSPEDIRPNLIDLKIVLVGKNASENNRVGNLILDKNVFEKKTFTSDVEEHSGKVEGRNITVISTIHLLNTQLKLQKIAQKVSELSPPEPDVIILVLQHNDFSERKRDKLPSVLKCFGEQMMERTMILTTDDETPSAKQKPVKENEFIQQISTECGGGHLQLQNTQRSQILQKADEIINRSGFKETQQASSLNQVDMCRSCPDISRPIMSLNISGKQKLNLVLCGSDSTLKDSVSKLLRGKNPKYFHERASSEECVKREEKIHGRQISLVKLPALSRLSEEEVMRQSLNCVSLFDPGVHAFLLVVPVGPLTDEVKAEIEKIQRNFFFKEHFILLFTSDLPVEGPVTDFVKSSTESLRLISLCEGQYRVIGLKEPENSQQIPELLDYIENMKTEPYSAKMYVKAQENRATQELEEEHKKQLSELENKIKELEQKIQSDGAEDEADDQGRLRIVLIGRTGNGKSATGNTILGRNEFQSLLNTDSVTTVCEKRVGDVDGRSVAVVDTPGLFDTTLKNEQVAEEIMKCVSLSSPGPHVFVIVLSLGRFTKEETDTIDLIKKIFGPKAAQFSIVLFTRGDDLEKESIQDYVKRSNNADLKKLIRDCGDRFLSFNNREKQDKTQVIQLINMIEDLKHINQGRYFTNSMFEEAEMSIKKRMEEILKERETEIQAQNDALKAKYETEMEELKKRLEEEKRKAEEERKQRENEFREKEEKLIKDFEEKYKIEQQKRETENKKRSEEEKQQRAEYHRNIEEMKRETEIQRLQYEKQQKEREEEDRKREEKYRQEQEKMKFEQERIKVEFQNKQEEERKKRESEERKRIEQEEKERQEWERKIKEAENDRKETQEDIKRQQREWGDEKKRQMREREEEERKRKEKHEEQLREKQEELEKMRKRLEREREEERQKIEEEIQKQRNEREEKEREYEEKKAEIKRHYEQLERERKEEWERRKREDDERREEERKIWKKMIEDLKQEPEEEKRRRETEDKEKKEREENERDEMKKKHEEKIKDMKKKHEDEARKQAEETNELKERKEALQQELDEHKKEKKLLEELFKQLKDQKEKDVKELQEEVEHLCQSLQEQKEKEINELKKQAEALNEHLKDQKGEKIEALQEEVKKLCQSLKDIKQDKIKEIQQEGEKLNQHLQEHLNNLKKEAEEREKNSHKSNCIIL